MKLNASKNWSESDSLDFEPAGSERCADRAEGRIYFRSAPWIVLIPGGLFAMTVRGINLMGDALRDALDPKVAKSL